MEINTQFQCLQTENKEVLTEYTELWNEIKSQIVVNMEYQVNTNTSEYGKDFIKIKFNSDHNLTLNKILKLHNLTVIVTSVLFKFFLNECLYEL